METALHPFQESSTLPFENSDCHLTGAWTTVHFMGSSLPSLRQKLKQQTRTEIVRRAVELFARHGYDRVPVEMICEAVGIARATFFNYFPQKDLILREIARTRVEKLK